MYLHGYAIFDLCRKSIKQQYVVLFKTVIGIIIVSKARSGFIIKFSQVCVSKRHVRILPPACHALGVPRQTNRRCLLTNTTLLAIGTALQLLCQYQVCIKCKFFLRRRKQGGVPIWIFAFSLILRLFSRYWRQSIVPTTLVDSTAIRQICKNLLLNIECERDHSFQPRT